MLWIMSKRSGAVARWREILRKQRASGLTVAAFCRRSRIAPASFYLWRRKLRKATTFTEVCVAADPVPAIGALELILPGGRRIVVRPGFDRATLSALVDALEHGTANGGGQESSA
jgi:hypothetical protein